MRRSALLRLALLGAAGAGPLAAQTPTFSARVEAVYVDVFVTRDGRPLSGLRATDFELRDNGVVQRVELLAAESMRLSVLLAFDASGSVRGEKLAALRSAGRALLGSLRPHDEVGLISFNQEIVLRAPLTRDHESTRRALDDLEAGGTTAALDALYAGLTLPAADARGLLVLFSDGQDNQSWLRPKTLRALAERSNMVVHVVGLRAQDSHFVPTWDNPREPEEPAHIRALREIAETTGGRFWLAESVDRLKDAFAAIGEAMNARYVLSYQPAGVRRDGWHAIKVRLRKAKGDLQARRGYWATPPRSETRR